MTKKITDTISGQTPLHVNGNGRHARILADILVQQFKLPELKWGSKKIGFSGADRAAYINSLKIADQGDYQALIQFATK